MRLALAVASISAAAALAVGGAAPALAATSEPGPTAPAGTVAGALFNAATADGPVPPVTGAADAALPFALGGLGLAVLAGGGGYLVGRGRRDPEEPRGGEAEAVPTRPGVRRQDADQDGAPYVLPPYCVWW